MVTYLYFLGVNKITILEDTFFVILFLIYITIINAVVWLRNGGPLAPSVVQPYFLCSVSICYFFNHMVSLDCILHKLSDIDGC